MASTRRIPPAASTWRKAARGCPTRRARNRSLLNQVGGRGTSLDTVACGHRHLLFAMGPHADQPSRHADRRMVAVTGPDTVDRVPLFADQHDRRIVALALPALGALAVEPLYVLVDTAIIGHLGTEPLAGLALASTVLLLVVAGCNFLAYGTTQRVAHQRGADRPPRPRPWACRRSGWRCSSACRWRCWSACWPSRPCACSAVRARCSTSPSPTCGSAPSGSPSCSWPWWATASSGASPTSARRW